MCRFRRSRLEEQEEQDEHFEKQEKYQTNESIPDQENKHASNHHHGLHRRYIQTTAAASRGAEVAGGGGGRDTKKAYVLPEPWHAGLPQIVLEQRGLAGQPAGRRAPHAAAQRRPQLWPERPEVW